MNYLNKSISILIVLFVSRYVPHPPNFTILIAMSFYVPIIFGFNYLPIVFFSFVITDIFFGIHLTTFFTWGSILLISYFSINFSKYFSLSFVGLMISCIIFYILTNFGVWLTGSYGYNLNGLMLCYVAAIPFFINTILGTIFYSTLIELFRKFYNKRQGI